MRSSSGPDRRRRWRVRSACEHWQREPPRPHGQGFEAATSMKRVGKTMTCWPRTIVTWPSSSGWRSASRLGRANSDSSSRNSTPRCASVASPGCGGLAPPTSPAAEIVWCGARNGRARTRPAAPRRPATDRIRVTSIASSGASGGRIDGSRRAIIVLPVPGGPCRNRLWPPAAATSSPGISPLWPRTSASSASGSPDLASPPPAATGGSASPRRVATSSLQRLDPDDLELAHQRRLARPRTRHHEPRAARPAGALGHRQGAADRAHLARQRQLAHHRAALDRVRLELVRRHQQRDRQRQVERRARPCAGRPARG